MANTNTDAVKTLYEEYQESFERQIAESAPDATLSAFTESVKKGGAVIVRGNELVRVTPGGIEVLQTIEAPYASRPLAVGTKIKVR